MANKHNKLAFYVENLNDRAKIDVVTSLATAYKTRLLSSNTLKQATWISVNSN